MKDCTCTVGIGGGVIEWCPAHKYSVERDLGAVKSRLKEAEESDAESLKLYRAARDRAERLGRENDQLQDRVKQLHEYIVGCRLPIPAPMFIYGRPGGDEKRVGACCEGFGTHGDAHSVNCPEQSKGTESP